MCLCSVHYLPVTSHASCCQRWGLQTQSLPWWHPLGISPGDLTPRQADSLISGHNQMHSAYILLQGVTPNQAEHGEDGIGKIL